MGELLAEKYGRVLLHIVFMEIHGYPMTLDPSPGEMLKVRDWFEK